MKTGLPVLKKDGGSEAEPKLEPATEAAGE